MKFKSLLLTLCLTVSSFSYSYTAFSVMTGEKTIVVNPFLAFDGTGAVINDLFVSYGITNNIDIWSNVTLTKTADYTDFDFSTMVRYDIGNSNIVAVRVSQWYVTPQYHFTIENDRFGFQANVAGQISFDYYKEPAIYTILCPLVKFLNFDAFVEVNPGYYMHDGDFANMSVRSEGFDLDIVPGIGITLGQSSFSISCPIYNVISDATPTFGMWWTCPIGGK